jgi:hypothetical protein
MNRSGDLNGRRALGGQLFLAVRLTPWSVGEDSDAETENFKLLKSDGGDD